MSSQTTHRSVDFKLYLSRQQEETLSSWLRTCAWVYNQMLEQRRKAYERRRQSVSLYDQTHLLAVWRSRMPQITAVPSMFARDAVQRVDRGMQAFFRRVKAGDKKPGYLRFKPQHRYNSMECVQIYSYLRDSRIAIPKLGLVRCRGINQDTSGKQKILRILRKPSGWYAQILFERELEAAPVPPLANPVGVDVGLLTFAALSTGERIPNPRWAKRSAHLVRFAHRAVSRKRKGSSNRHKAVRRLGRIQERITAQRKDFAHQQSRLLVNRFSMIVFESLNIAGMARGRFAKSILDAAWGVFLRFTSYKAAEAGKVVVEVKAAGTSQECPQCGTVQRKRLSERVHSCACGCTLDRDVASSKVILARGARAVASLPVEGGATAAEPALSRKPTRRSRKSRATATPS